MITYTKSQNSVLGNRYTGISQASFDQKLLHTTLGGLSRLVNVVNVVS